MTLWYEMQISDCRRSFTNRLTPCGRSSARETLCVPATKDGRYLAWTQAVHKGTAPVPDVQAYGRRMIAAGGLSMQIGPAPQLKR